ncbi:DnaJ-like protein subfamily C member 3 [Geosmithia morbida]|uniref:Tetratricopeptide repeat and J domain-containing co-chaperone DNJ1 n=1 Tax=Geosmithia morbida TaxID=1094350 RepID=A0A9P4YTW2_9HYPO|nr:DnaJ-like protein subfamily C member 3 [Geosmithia morbida]KAF4121571.1 DnaJ-like protein subfamily C member 3 [Geosmithia morbida]
MALRLCTLAMAASLIATGATISPQEIPTDVPVSSILTTAQGHLTRGETNEALMYYDAAIARDPSNYLSLFKRGATYLSLGKTNKATADFNKVLALEPNFEGAHLQLARIKSRSADWEGARAGYLAAGKGADSIEMQELDEAKGAVDLAEAAAAAGQWEECVSHAGAAILVAGRSAPLRELRSRCRFARGEVEEGIADLQHLLSMRPGDTNPHVIISATSFYGLDALDKGVDQARKCLHSDPESKVCKKLLKQEKAIQKAYAKIITQLERGQMTTAGRALVGHGEESGLINDINDQIAALRKAGSIPESVSSRLYQHAIEMTCQAYSESNHKDATKYCTETIDLDAKSFWGLLHQGKSQLRSEDWEAAIRTLQEAAEAHPDKKEQVDRLLHKAQNGLKRSKTKDYYKVLGVSHDADERQIKSAYRKQTKQFHPDKAAKQGISKEEAEKKMASINEAYEVLSNPELKARFDNGDDPNSQEQQHRHPFQQGGSPFNFQGGHTQFKFTQGGGRKAGGQGGWPFGGGGPGGPFGAQFGF